MRPPFRAGDARNRFIYAKKLRDEAAILREQAELLTEQAEDREAEALHFQVEAESIVKFVVTGR